MPNATYTNLNNLKKKLIEQSIEINNKRYITRETLKKLLSLDYEKVRSLTKNKKWSKIAEKIATQGSRYTLYFPIDKIDNSMLTKLIEHIASQQNNQSKNTKPISKEPSSKDSKQEQAKSSTKKIKLKVVENKKVNTKTKEERRNIPQAKQLITTLSDNTGKESEKSPKELSILGIPEEDKAKLEEKLKSLSEVVNELIYYVAEVLYELQIIEERERLKRDGKYEKFCIKWKEWNEKLSPLFKEKLESKGA